MKKHLLVLSTLMLFILQLDAQTICSGYNALVLQAHGSGADAMIYKTEECTAGSADALANQKNFGKQPELIASVTKPEHCRIGWRRSLLKFPGLENLPAN